jgi:hypothetical protein
VLALLLIAPTIGFRFLLIGLIIIVIVTAATRPVRLR